MRHFSLNFKFRASLLALISRWSTAILAGEVQATGTACSGLNIWPQGAIWQPRSVRFVSGVLCHHSPFRIFRQTESEVGETV